MLLSTPNGLQYSANKNTMAKAEINMLMILALSADIFSLTDSKPTIPYATSISPRVCPKITANRPIITKKSYYLMAFYKSSMSWLFFLFLYTYHADPKAVAPATYLG